MMQAVYQPQNIGHFGLALKHYAHFTSPIRRYPDLVVHRTPARVAVGCAIRMACVTTAAQLALAGAELTQLEKRADESDRYVNAWLKCVYLRDRIGQTFEGLITTVVEFGAFVQLTAVGTDGLLHIDNLRDDEYVMEPGGRAWVGRAQQAPAGAGRARARHRHQRESHRGSRRPGAGRRRERRARCGAAEVAASRRPSRSAGTQAGRSD